jgi:hypothetical protein
MEGGTGVAAIIVGLVLAVLGYLMLRQGRKLRASVPEDRHEGAADADGATLRYGTTLRRSGHVILAVGLFNVAWGLIMAFL